jgi:hypothetical protein
MGLEYSVEVCRTLEESFAAAKLHRPMRVSHYEPGTQLAYEARGVVPAVSGRVQLEVEKFVGGGFAGQVYRVKVLEVEGGIAGLEVGRMLALKILVPPSRFSELFRNVVYGVGFQGPFQLQVNPAAARAGVLWQKFIRRAAKIRFGDENCVVDVLATLVDEQIGSCGELSEWVEGRTWRLEVDDHLDELKRWKKGKAVDEAKLGSSEYRTKRVFMGEFVKLLHEMGAPEFARQYEWSTCKSQPNCLKRWETESDPEQGLTAVDFRAGLALLPLLPMSPGDFKLIGKGLARGSLVQFDRGSLKKLQQYMDSHGDEFADMQDALAELKESERIYRDSLPDITHNHVRLLGSRRLWSTMFASTVTSWRIRNVVDAQQGERFKRSRFMALLFFLLGLISKLCTLTAIVGILGGIGLGMAAISGNRSESLPSWGIAAGICFGGGFILASVTRFLRRIWGRADYRRHYANLLGSWDYFKRAIRAKIAEKLIEWHRAGRVNDVKALEMVQKPLRFFIQVPLGILPAKLHRMLTDRKYTQEVLAFIFVRPLLLYFNAELREQWLRDMVAQGQKNHLLTEDDAGVILGQINEPFIQKYLKSLAVHVCTLPVTQVVSVILAAIYYFTHRDQPNAWAIGMGIIAVFQVTPISPGSICRGLYVVYLVIREKNFKDYNIAVFLGFFKYVGYLAFPIQMAYRFPVLARFMAAHWATGAVHAVPVFGERGALLEHWVFSVFYNWPLTIRRRIQVRAEWRKQFVSRSWQVSLWALLGGGLFLGIDTIFLHRGHELPHLLYDLWWAAVLIPVVAGSAVTLSAGGTVLGRRIVQAAICGFLIGLLYAIGHSVIDGWLGIKGLIGIMIWRVFIFAILATIGAILTELKLPEPREKMSNQ